MWKNPQPYEHRILFIVLYSAAFCGNAFSHKHNKMDSNDNIKMIRNLYADFNAGNMEGVMAGIAEDASWTIVGDPNKLPISGTFKGHAEIIALFKRVFEVLDIGSNEPDQLFASGDNVVGTGRLTAKVRSNGALFESPHADHFQLRNGKIQVFHRFLDTLALFEAVSAPG